jgi:hypothetical protein
MLLAACSKSGNPPKLSSNTSVRAISLNALQLKLKSCVPNGSCSPELFQLAGLSRLEGMIIDRTNNDLILYGRSSGNSPPLNLDDLVIALQHAWLKFAKRNDNVVETMSPGCSIDPFPENIRALEAIDQQTHPRTSLAEQEKQLEMWRLECEKPQAVRVLGIPFNSHFAKVMVQADYDLKRLADGSDVLDLPGFVSITDEYIDQAQTALSEQKPIALPGSILNRFWLYPGENTYEEADDAFFIKRSPVTLQTELMHSNAKGEISGAGVSDPSAGRFANDFTLLYERIEEDRAIYQELEGLFRFVAVATILKDRSERSAPLNLGYLLDEYKVPEVKVETSLAGRHAVKEIQQTSEDSSGRREVHFWLRSCGGVDIALDRWPVTTSLEQTGTLAALKAAILKAKPAPDALYWDYFNENQLSELELNSRLLASNLANRNSLVIGVVYKADGYLVYDGQSQPLYRGDDLTELVRTVKAKAGSGNGKVTQAFLIGFPDAKRAQSFLDTYEIQSLRYNLIRNPRVDNFADFIEQRNLLFTPGVRLDKSRSYVEPVSSGEHQGKHRLVLNFLARAGRAIMSVTVHVITETREVAEAFLAGVIARVNGSNFSSAKTLADIVEETQRDLETRFSPQQIIRIYLDQYGGKPLAELSVVKAESDS